jgi:hypothetical protein
MPNKFATFPRVGAFWFRLERFWADGICRSTSSSHSMSCAEVGEVKMNLKVFRNQTSCYVSWATTHLKEDSTTKKTTLYIIDVACRLGIEKGRPGICSDCVIRVAFTDMSSHAMREDRSVHWPGQWRMSAAHKISFQSYSIGHSRRPVSSCSNPRSSLEVGRRGTDRRVPSMFGIQLMMAGFILAASSPLAPPKPFLSYLRTRLYIVLEAERGLTSRK